MSEVEGAQILLILRILTMLVIIFQLGNPRMV